MLPASASTQGEETANLRHIIATLQPLSSRFVADNLINTTTASDRLALVDEYNRAFRADPPTRSCPRLFAKIKAARLLHAHNLHAGKKRDVTLAYCGCDPLDVQASFLADKYELLRDRAIIYDLQDFKEKTRTLLVSIVAPADTIEKLYPIARCHRGDVEITENTRPMPKVSDNGRSSNMPRHPAAQVPSLAAKTKKRSATISRLLDTPKTNCWNMYSTVALHGYARLNLAVPTSIFGGAQVDLRGDSAWWIKDLTVRQAQIQDWTAAVRTRENDVDQEVSQLAARDAYPMPELCSTYISCPQESWYTENVPQAMMKDLQRATEAFDKRKELLVRIERMMGQCMAHLQRQPQNEEIRQAFQKLALKIQVTKRELSDLEGEIKDLRYDLRFIEDQGRKSTENKPIEIAPTANIDHQRNDQVDTQAQTQDSKPKRRLPWFNIIPIRWKKKRQQQQRQQRQESKQHWFSIKSSTEQLERHQSHKDEMAPRPWDSGIIICGHCNTAKIGSPLKSQARNDCKACTNDPVAKEPERHQFRIPSMKKGATTSACAAQAVGAVIPTAGFTACSPKSPKLCGSFDSCSRSCT